jgi:glucokinase
LAVDVGGTNARLSLFAINPNDKVILKKLESGKM